MAASSRAARSPGTSGGSTLRSLSPRVIAASSPMAGISKSAATESHTNVVAMVSTLKDPLALGGSGTTVLLRPDSSLQGGSTSGTLDTTLGPVGSKQWGKLWADEHEPPSKRRPSRRKPLTQTATAPAPVVVDSTTSRIGDAILRVAGSAESVKLGEMLRDGARATEPVEAEILGRRVQLSPLESPPLRTLLRRWVKNHPGGRPTSPSDADDRASSDLYHAGTLPPLLPHTTESLQRLRPDPTSAPKTQAELFCTDAPAPTLQALLRNHVMYFRELKDWHRTCAGARQSRSLPRMLAAGIDPRAQAWITPQYRERIDTAMRAAAAISSAGSGAVSPQQFSTVNVLHQLTVALSPSADVEDPEARSATSSSPNQTQQQSADSQADAGDGGRASKRTRSKNR